MKDLEDKILGMCLGAALGDALGAPHERNKKFKYTGKLEFPIIHTKSHGHGTFISVIGQVSDDTEMSLILMRSIIKNKGKYVRDDVLQAYLNWANDKRNFFLGKNTRKFFKNVTTIKGYENRIKKLTNEDKQQMQSNGALMRSYPLSLIEYKDVIKDVSLSNPNDFCIDLELLYIKELKKFLFEKVDDPFNILNRNIPEEVTYEIDDKSPKSWVLVAYKRAINSLKCKTYKEGIDSVISLGGDVDTNASIAGALLGAKFGYKKMIEDKITVENINILLSYDPNKGNIPKNKKLHPKKFLKYTKKIIKIFEENI